MWSQPSSTRSKASGLTSTRLCRRAALMLMWIPTCCRPVPVHSRATSRHSLCDVILGDRLFIKAVCGSTPAVLDQQGGAGQGRRDCCLHGNYIILDKLVWRLDLINHLLRGSEITITSSANDCWFWPVLSINSPAVALFDTMLIYPLCNKTCRNVTEHQTPQGKNNRF